MGCKGLDPKSARAVSKPRALWCFSFSVALCCCALMPEEWDLMWSFWEGNPGMQKAAAFSKLVPVQATGKAGTWSLMGTASHLQVMSCPDQKDIKHKAVVNHVPQENEISSKTLNSLKTYQHSPLERLMFSVCLKRKEKNAYSRHFGVQEMYWIIYFFPSLNSVELNCR